MSKIFKSIYHFVFQLDFLVCLVSLVFSCWLMWSTFGYQNNQFVIDSKLYSDFGAHLPLIRSFSLGKNFPPQYPQFAGPAISYHYLFYLVVGLLELAGLNLATALNLLSSLGFALLLVMIYFWTKRIFASKLAGLLSIILFLFNSSLSFIEFFKHMSLQSNFFTQLVQLKNFVSFGPWDGKIVSAFWNLNVFTNQRHLGLSYGLVLLLLWPLVKLLTSPKTEPAQPRGWQVLMICLAFLFFPLLHQAGYAILLIFTVALFVLFKNLRQSAWLKVYLLALILSLPMFFALPSAYPIHFKPGFLARSVRLADLSYYWLFNLGLGCLLWPIYFWWQKPVGKKLLLIFSSFWLLANLWQFSPDMINNHKFVSFFLIGLAMFNAGFLAKLFKLNKLGLQLLAWCFFIILTLSGWVDFFPIVNDYATRVDDYHNSEIMTYLKTYTEPDAVFLTTTYFYNPVLLVGRKTFLDYGYFAWSLGYDDHSRRAKLVDLFSPTISSAQLCLKLTDNQIDYVLFSPGEGSLDPIKAKDSIIYTSFAPVYQSKDGYQLFSVAKICFGQLAF